MTTCKQQHNQITRISPEFLVDVADYMPGYALREFERQGYKVCFYVFTFLTTDVADKMISLVVQDFSTGHFTARIPFLPFREQKKYVEEIVKLNSHLTINFHLIEPMYSGTDFQEGYTTLLIPYRVNYLHVPQQT